MFTNLNKTKEMIAEGKLLHIAADESLLSQLPKGNWIGGTTPYFISNEGGIKTKEKLFVTELDMASHHKFCVYDTENVENVPSDAFSNGLTFLLMPFSAEVTAEYCKKAPSMDDLLMHPAVGWITGFDLDAGGCAKVFDGSTGTSYADKAVALHIELPEGKLASIGIVNIFDEDNSNDIIEFPKDDLVIEKCRINGKDTLFSSYIMENGIDTKLPLQANCNGSLLNISIKEITHDGTVCLFAPVFADEKYRFAKAVPNYADAFGKKLAAQDNITPVFSCNCILNYLYGELEGKSTPPYEGPVTFGEIAYQLLNQTLVYAGVL
ncbi:MAG: hypothetical protein K6F52_07010 [Clostridia bacterium]|nr:hypothetical protein [Clostridia bacterium]